MLRFLGPVSMIIIILFEMGNQFSSLSSSFALEYHCQKQAAAATTTKVGGRRLWLLALEKFISKTEEILLNLKPEEKSNTQSAYQVPNENFRGTHNIQVTWFCGKMRVVFCM